LENSNGKILFVKPFEVDSSGSSFAEVWRNIKKILLGSAGIHSAELVRSLDSTAKFGFASLSVWDSKQAFSNAVKGSTILKYHVSGNGSEARSEASFLYKIMESRNVNFGEKEKEFVLLNFISTNRDDDILIKNYWEAITEIFGNKDFLVRSHLCKSASRNSGFTNVIIIKFLSKGLKDLLKQINNVINGPGLFAESLYSVYDSNLFDKIEYKNIINIRN
jgi:heme-degrading monooxygenase HmoA